MINGPIRAIAVAPHIDKPDANKILSLISSPNIFPKIKNNTNENMMKKAEKDIISDYSSLSPRLINNLDNISDFSIDTVPTKTG